MDDAKLGAVFRAVRMRRGARQVDVARRARVSPSVISRFERGHLDSLSLSTLRRIAGALDIRIEIRAFSRGGDLDRLVNARHSALHESIARSFASLDGWRIHPEVTFAVAGERGVIDILAIHRERRIVLVIELKTEIVDVNELVGTFDRKLRLALRVAAERDWIAGPGWVVAGWVMVADSRTNRRRLQAHAAMLRAAFPADGRTIGPWLARPSGPIRALGFRVVEGSGSTRRRVRRAGTDTRAKRAHVA
jgi:transcriptional regulator with XRE-family HTH domain